MFLRAGLPWEHPPGTPTGGYVAADLIETEAAARGAAVAVPNDFFDGSHDTRWTLDGDSYKRVRP